MLCFKDGGVGVQGLGLRGLGFRDSGGASVVANEMLLWHLAIRLGLSDRSTLARGSSREEAIH